jgi:hypothetical protein
MWVIVYFKRRPAARAAVHATQIGALSFDGLDMARDDFDALFDDLHVGARDGAALGARRRQRLIHDAADGARASSALRAASKAAIDLVGGGRAGGGTIESGPHIAVAEDVAGTNDHYVTLPLPGSNWSLVK